MLRTPPIRQSLLLAMLPAMLPAILGVCIASLVSPATAGSPSGRFLLTPRSDIVLECNLNASNCFFVTGAVKSAGDGGGDQDVSLASEPSIAQNGTIAFDAVYGPDGTCIPGGQGICWNHVFLMNADGTNVRQITFNPTNTTDAMNFGGDNFASISPDGTTVAFVATRNAAPDGSYHAQVYLVNVDGSNLRQITFPVPDSSSPPVYHGTMYGVGWSPDSKTLAYRGYVYTIFCGDYFGGPQEFGVVGKINADGTGDTYLACTSHQSAAGNAIDWSPDGTVIAYNREGLSDPVIAFIDLSASGRFSNGLAAFQVGIQPRNAGQICPGDGHCIHFSPDSTQLAYENNGPSDNSSFFGISTINLDGGGRSDGAPFGVTLEHGIWWDAGAYPAPAAQITLAPNTVEVWPGFTQQLTPSLLDASNNLILHTEYAYNINYAFNHSCSIEIGPYGLVMFRSIQSGNEGSTISVTNDGASSNGVPLKCFASPPCTFTLGFTSLNSTASGGSYTEGVTADAGGSGSSCPWGSASNASWIVITSGSSGRGAGNVSFTVAANTGAARQGAVTIAGITVTITQDAVNTVTLQSITVSPNSASVAAGLTKQFTATGNYSDSSTKDLTTSVTWSSSNTGIATISNTGGSQGLAKGVTAGGPITITAALNNVSGGAQLTVTAPVLQSIGVTPANPSVPTGSTQQFTATGTYSDGSVQNITGSAAWTSSNTTVAPIGASSGSASALAVGTTTIKAAVGAISGSTTMTVITLQSITITPVNPSILVGSTQQFIATGHYNDGSTRDLTSSAAWTSMKTSVATITSSGGLATGMAKGSTTIKGSVGAVSGSTTLTVNQIVLQSITVAPAIGTIAVNGTQQFKATGNYNNGTTQDLTSSVSWSASPKMVASISSTGLATGLKAGTATINTKSGGTTGSATLTVQ